MTFRVLKCESCKHEWVPRYSADPKVCPSCKTTKWKPNMKNKIVNNQGRQGDVLVQRVSELPKGLTKQKPEQGKIILAHGEVTNHMHSIDFDKADWWKNGGDQFINVSAPVEIIHQEHAPVPLSRGMFRVVRQKEYTPQAIRNVAD